MCDNIPADELNFWRKAMYHEAGHAAATLALWGDTADITVKNFTEEDGATKKGVLSSERWALTKGLDVHPWKP